jgi:RsiW-degrading membrane proteinase PrsW (M82 family)
MELLALSFAPVLIILIYVYFRDKYEKEPLKILSVCLLVGALSPIPIIIADGFLIKTWNNLGFPSEGLYYAAYKAFIVAGAVEEFFKFLFLVLLIWRLKSFNERFDGIVYAVFISLGFAVVENLLYVFSKGTGAGFTRMFTAVPGHAIYGITMGYYFGLAKFVSSKRRQYLCISIMVPIALHGFYDFIIFSKLTFLLLLFIPYMIWLYYKGHFFMQEHRKNSEFAPVGGTGGVNNKL